MRCLGWCWGLLLCLPAALQAFEYKLQPQQIAENTWAVLGPNEEFTRTNGGHEINTAFIVTEEGVVVIDTGPSRLYGEALRSLIESITDQQVVRVFLTNHLPDRFLGSQAFAPGSVAALPQTIEQLKLVGPALLDNMYRLVGEAMRGTELRLPQTVVQGEVEEFGSHRLRLLALHGHTPGDLVILDEKTGVLFTGGVVFHGRTPTTPFADLNDWQAELDRLETLDFRALVPSHGGIAVDRTPIRQTREYLNWLDQTFQQAASQGLHMNEVMRLSKPAELQQRWDLLREEFPRTVVHLYPDYELKQLRLVGTPE